MFGNRALRRIFGPKRAEVKGGCRRQHNEELHNLYASPNVIGIIKSRRIIWTRHVALIKEMRNSYSILVGKPEEKRRLERPSRRWKTVLEWILGK
jgi:hypothetical protein